MKTLDLELKILRSGICKILFNFQSIENISDKQKYS